ncbi:type II toxin-antitoxin system VapC family toxin [Candidatus Poriferisodalis sp.]|uniref:type II toxin-antitoxin system VapC family toxin n=1 Tax=Candidatus Poriferisodalis sp. TaxID=3101277 RepID=UPI003C704796
MSSANEVLIVDASAVVDLLIDASAADAIRARLRQNELHAPAHLDVEVLSAIGRLHRGGLLSAKQVTQRLEIFRRLPIRRHLLDPLLAAAWEYRHDLRLTDALYAALSDQVGMPIVTTDRGLVAAVPQADLPTAP